MGGPCAKKRCMHRKVVLVGIVSCGIFSACGGVMGMATSERH